jgi:mycothiol synthase
MRAPREDDIPTIVELASQHSPEPLAEATLRTEWSSPRIDLERDARIEANAYVLVESFDEDRVWVGIDGRPSRELIDWAEARALELGTRILSGAWSTNGAVLEVLEQRGFRLVRHSHRMLIDLDQPTPEPTWPDGIELRTFEPGDERLFYDVHQETFQDSWEPIDEPYDEWAHWLLSPPTFVPELWFLAAESGRPAGIAICHPHSSMLDHGWIRILGVKRNWRRRGVGRALLYHAFTEFRRRGLVAAGLGVDAESLTGAHRLYEEVGMRVHARFDIYEKSGA